MNSPSTKAPLANHHRPPATETSAKSSDLVLPLDAFIRSIGVNQKTPHSFLLGAGASISSGIPSAQTCIWEWKRSLFLTKNPDCENQFAELSLPGVQRRIQQWLDSQGTFPKEGENGEYGFYVRECFPIADDRRTYFQEKILGVQPHIGYRLLCHLAQVDIIRTIWSTNFDGLPARAAANFRLRPIEVGIDTQSRLSRQAVKGELLCVSLHGDYRYDDLKNTEEEVQRQEKGFLDALIQDTQHRVLIVCGYSGRDQSVMDALSVAYSRAGTGALYWCGYDEGDIPEHIATLLSHARVQGREAHYVPIIGFDDLMTRLVQHCLKGECLEAARADIASVSSKEPLARVPFQVADYRANTLIKSNAFEINCPIEIISFDLRDWPKEKAWKWLREMVATSPIVIAPFEGKVLALGAIKDIKDVFADNIKGPVKRIQISPAELHYENGVIVRLMREAFVRSLAHVTGIPTDGHSELWLKEPLRKTWQSNLHCHAHESVKIFLRQVGNTQYVILKPSIKVLDAGGVEVPHEIANPVKLRILGYQHNKPFNTAIRRWQSRLFPKEQSAKFVFPLDSEFEFHVQCLPTFAQIGLIDRSRSVSIKKGHCSLIKHKGFELREPTLVFCNRSGTGTATDTYPVRGIVENCPYDFPITLNGLQPLLRIGIVCPSREASLLYDYLQKINQVHRPKDQERDYLVDYPGFQHVYRQPVEMPKPGDPGWVVCDEPTGTDDRLSTVSTAHRITGAINVLQSSYIPHVVLIFFPRRWSHLREYHGNNERFNVHDFVKAYAVQHGITTQFLKEDTLYKSQQCRVWWWLSLALYVKSMRTPWVLDGLDKDTAFVGLGFSIDQNVERGAHVVLGCSHIYSTRGEGLQYRLSKVEDPTIRGKNPFMSKDDARRTGETIRQLFFEAHRKLPRRVVLHKRTPFLKEEREGLLDGLGGIDIIDMLEIQEDHALRYVASIPRWAGRMDADNYPVRRGTVLRLDDFTALMWVHGATDAINSNRKWKYFQGKRRIPAPMKLYRSAGTTPLQQLCAEILGLSKMNWNHFDLYSKLPATLQSSGEIARIGSSLHQFGTSSFDYRLFI